MKRFKANVCLCIGVYVRILKEYQDVVYTQKVWQVRVILIAYTKSSVDTKFIFLTEGYI